MKINRNLHVADAEAKERPGCDRAGKRGDDHVCEIDAVQDEKVKEQREREHLRNPRAEQFPDRAAGDERERDHPHELENRDRDGNFNRCIRGLGD